MTDYRPPNTGLSYLCGGKLAYVTAATVTIGCAGLDSDVVDKTGVYLMTWTGALTADITAAGAGGLDAGAEEGATWYAVHAIGDTTDANTPKALLSLSATAPTLPSGYDVSRRLGWVRNDAGSNFLPFLQSGCARARWTHYDLTEATGRVLAGGAAAAWADVALSALVPSTADLVSLLAYFRTGAGGAATDCLLLRPDGFTAAAASSLWMVAPGLVSGSWHRAQVILPSVGQIVEYRVSDAANNDTDLHVVGYSENL